MLSYKPIKHELYRDFQSLLVSNHEWKDLLIDFITRLPILTNWKGDSYNLISVIVYWLIKIIYYKSILVIINIPKPAIIILDIVFWHHSLPDLIITNKNYLFILKFWFLLCYFFDIKYKISIVFYF